MLMNVDEVLSSNPKKHIIFVFLSLIAVGSRAGGIVLKPNPTVMGVSLPVLVMGHCLLPTGEAKSHSSGGIFLPHIAVGSTPGGSMLKPNLTVMRVSLSVLMMGHCRLSTTGAKFRSGVSDLAAIVYSDVVKGKECFALPTVALMKSLDCGC